MQLDFNNVPNHEVVHVQYFIRIEGTDCLKLLSSVWIFCCVPSLKGDSATIHSNLCGCLLLAHILLLVGLDATGNAALCYAIAVTLHFLFLASFCWMLAEGKSNILLRSLCQTSP